MTYQGCRFEILRGFNVCRTYSSAGKMRITALQTPLQARTERCNYGTPPSSGTPDERLGVCGPRSAQHQQPATRPSMLPLRVRH